MRKRRAAVRFLPLVGCGAYLVIIGNVGNTGAQARADASNPKYAFDQVSQANTYIPQSSIPGTTTSPRIYYQTSFEDGTLSPCTGYNVNTTASVSVVTTQFHSGARSAYMNSDGNAVLCDMNPSGAPDPQRYSTDSNGLYWSFWFYTDSATIKAVLNCDGCGSPSTGHQAQWKISSTRTNLERGGSSMCPGSLTTNGLPYDSHGSNPKGMYGWWDVCGGLNIHEGSIPIRPKTWHRVQFWSTYNDTNRMVSPVVGRYAKSVPPGKGRLIVTFDGKQIGDDIQPYYGAPCTPASMDVVTQQPCQGPFYPNEKLSIVMGLYDLINPYPHDAPLQIWIDDVCAADGPVCP